MILNLGEGGGGGGIRMGNEKGKSEWASLEMKIKMKHKSQIKATIFGRKIVAFNNKFNK